MQILLWGEENCMTSGSFWLNQNLPKKNKQTNLIPTSTNCPEELRSFSTGKESCRSRLSITMQESDSTPWISYSTCRDLPLQMADSGREWGWGAGRSLNPSEHLLLAGSVAGMTHVTWFLLFIASQNSLQSFPFTQMRKPRWISRQWMAEAGLRSSPLPP